MSMDSLDSRKPSRTRSYLIVFLALTVITAVEVGLATFSIMREFLTILLLALSLSKAALVALFYMHLKTNSRVYTAILLLPAAMFILFALLTVAS